MLRGRRITVSFPFGWEQLDDSHLRGPDGRVVTIGEPFEGKEVKVDEDSTLRYHEGRWWLWRPPDEWFYWEDDT